MKRETEVHICTRNSSSRY